ncbi:C40 family peptidase [Kitasatospora sp. NBC_00315]|uniref:C40 family peptidase n=1 Tax=Kitasatospora sp. NBC_00315 TaxID=2975963 RepID=UPI00324F231F
MRIAIAPATADPALAGFDESRGTAAAIAGCRCPDCASAARAATRAARAGAGRAHRAVRSTCLATTVVAGAGVIGLTAGAGAAHAASAPVEQGWDGSKYWFRTAGGEWRYTAHYDVYLNRIGGRTQSPASAPAPASASSAGGGGTSGTGLKQGWDGSKYWFRTAGGEWRYTAHYDVYLNRIGRSGSAAEPAGPARPAAPAAASDGAESSADAVDYALAQLGKPYVWGGNGPAGFDCSGLVQQAYRQSGIALPRVANDQYAATTPISAGELRRGDLLFWSDSGRASGIHHVGIYLGGGKFVEAPRPGRSVRISTLAGGYRPTHFGRPTAR